MWKKIITLFLMLIIIAIIYKSFSKETKKVYIDEVLTQEEIGSTERSVLDYIRNTKYTNDVYLEERNYIANDNVYKITIKVNGYKLYEAYVDLNKKDREGKYNNFVLVEKK